MLSNPQDSGSTNTLDTGKADGTSAQSMAQPRPRLKPVHPLLVWLESAWFAPWFRSKEFSADWVSAKIPSWCRILKIWRGLPIRVLEIGSWEGRSALFFLRYLPRSTIVCIDTFEGNPNLKENRWKEIPYIEGRFDRNLEEFGNRVTKIKCRSTAALDRLLADQRQFDLIYIDGSHTCEDVRSDTARAWPLLADNGIIIWDDYQWRPNFPPEKRPQIAIDEFLATHVGRYDLLLKATQVIIRRVHSGGEQPDDRPFLPGL